MAFKLDDIIVDRIVMGMAEDFDGNPLYTLTQLADGTIDVTAESKDAKDATGTLVKKFWQGKAGTFTANNAMINLNILAAASGTDKEVATSAAKIVMPKIVTVKAGSTLAIPDYIEGTVKVNALASNGTMGTAYTLAVSGSASTTEFSISGNVLTPPTDANESQYVVKYDRKVTDGVAIRNKADKFPGTVKLTLKALCVDPCSADTLRACYIVLPSFQVSPETSVALQTDAQLEYKGDLQVAYCSGDKTLYEIYIASDDEEDAE